MTVQHADRKRRPARDVDRPPPRHLAPDRKVVQLHRHGSVLDGPDPCHIAALHRPHPVVALLAWPPRGSRWESPVIRTLQTVAVLTLLTALLIAALANG